MAIQLGTVAAIGFESFPPAEWLGCFRQLGCEVVQAYRNQKAGVPLKQMLDAIEAGGMPCDSLHGVYGEEFDPSNPSESDRLSVVETFKSEGRLALDLGGSLVVVHCATVRKKGISAQEKAIRTDQLKKSIVELGQFGQSVGVHYAFENLPKYHAIGWDVGELTAILDELAAPNTGMCFDTGHAHISGDSAQSLAQASGQLIYVHLSDNSGASDDHDMPTCGTLDTDAIARQLHQAKYDGTVMLECFYDAAQLRKLIDDGCADRLARFVQMANGQAS